MMSGLPESALRVDLTSGAAGPVWSRGFFVSLTGCRIATVVKAFELTEGTPADFVRQVSSTLVERGLDEFVSVGIDGSELVARFRWMGTTELRYRLQQTARGFRADLEDERISPLHAPFRLRFEEKFDEVLEEVGALSL